MSSIFDSLRLIAYPAHQVVQSLGPTAYIRISSELNSAVYDVVKDAGMSFPFPQREVCLLGNDEENAVEKKNMP